MLAYFAGVRKAAVFDISRSSFVGRALPAGDDRESETWPSYLVPTCRMEVWSFDFSKEFPKGDSDCTDFRQSGLRSAAASTQNGRDASPKIRTDGTFCSW